ncbi:MAG: transcriptional regulator [Deltaproteobacteria bacterium SG8_13]|nr:MAG: transcriptional regulator [Deltaproteobacteria bacterium SG8_13]
MKVPLLDLKAQYATIRDEIRKVVDELFESQYFILGPQVEGLEARIAAYCSTRHAVGVSSGSDALLIALMAAGIGPGDSVITTPYTFFATAGSIARTGATPVFVDIDPDTFNISPVQVKQRIENMRAGERETLKALMPVHLYGQCADMQPLTEIAERYRLLVVEDAAQAIGSECGGRRAGCMGDFGCFSFFPSKNLGAFGDGGVVTTDSDSWWERLKIMRVHGSQPKYYHRFIGGNFRLDALQAAVVAVKLKYLDDWTAARQKNADTYRRLFAEAGLASVQLPEEKQNRHIYNQFVIRAPGQRDELRQYLQKNGVGSEVYYPVPLHLQDCFSYLQYREGDFPVAEQAARQTLALPIYPELTEDQQTYVVEKIREFYDRHVPGRR